MIVFPSSHRRWTFSVAMVPVLASFTLAAGGLREATADVSATVSEPVATGLVSPVFDFEVTGKSILVVQSDDTIGRIAPDGAVTRLMTSPHFPDNSPYYSIGGVAQGRDGRIYFTETDLGSGEVRTLSADGTVTTLADTLAYESANNPDAVNSYGVLGVSGDCAAQLPEYLQPHRGIVHDVYSNSPNDVVGALARTRYGLFVADRESNAILFVNWKGKIRTVAVLPPRRARITTAVMSYMGLPGCTRGKTIAIEQAPGDVELTRHGLVVSTDSWAFERPGSVYLVGWRKAKRLATGFTSIGGVAVSPRGLIYVSEPERNRVSRINVRWPAKHHRHRARCHGRHTAFAGHRPKVRVRTVAELNEPRTLEWARGRLLVSTTATTNPDAAEIVTITR